MESNISGLAISPAAFSSATEGEVERQQSLPGIFKKIPTDPFGTSEHMRRSEYSVIIMREGDLRFLRSESKLFRSYE